MIDQCMMRTIKSSGGLTRRRGMTKSTRDIWVSTIHACTKVHASMSTLTIDRFVNGEQYIECGETRQTRRCKAFQNYH